MGNIGAAGQNLQTAVLGVIDYESLLHFHGGYGWDLKLVRCCQSSSKKVLRVAVRAGYCINAWRAKL